jgi:LacI family transcriptional regulator
MSGVSTATVSRVFNTPESVSPEVQEKVRSVASKLAWIPHNAARALTTKRTNSLGIVIPTVKNSIFAEQVEGLQKRAAKHGYTTLVAHSGFNHESEAAQVYELVRHGIDGIMLVGADHLPEVYDLLSSRGIAYVNSSVCVENSPVPSVGFDNAGAMERITNHLISLGHTRIGTISGDTRASDRARLRLEGTRKAMKAAGLALDPRHIIASEYTMDSARMACRELMRRFPDITAIICHNDVQAFAAVLELQSRGILIPEDVSVTGFDDLDWVRHIRPGLTTVRVPWAQMAEIAADVLVAQLREQPFSHTTLLEYDLILRDSTAPPRAG